MEIVNKKVVIILIIIGIISSIFIWQNISDKETKLEIVSLNNETKSSSMFAIMLEQEDGTYKESEDNTWPSTAIYSYDGIRSGCMDPNGNKIENALTYDSENKIASVKTEKTSYCYLYFSIPKICETGTQIGECLLENPTLALNTNMEGGLYRYQGSVADNYICFGTNDIDECLNNTDKYLYRIIGINENNELKLIKNTSIGSMQWYSERYVDNIWPDSLIFNEINTNGFLKNSTYLSSDWESKILLKNWKYGDTTSNGNYDAEIIYAVESSWCDVIEAQIGLMYIHDYYYAYGIGGKPKTLSNAATSWIFSGVQEWMMTRYGKDNAERYAGWVIYTDGKVFWNYTNYGYDIRPAFYIASEIQYNYGLGTINYPFIIS